MCADVLAEWDEKHRAAAASGATPEPASFVRELLPLLPQGPALDLACGTGRHALLLAPRQQVTAVDGSGVALDILEKRARDTRTIVRRARDMEDARHFRPGIDLVQTNLERVTLPRSRFAVILCVHYLQRSLFPQIESALAKGGMLLFETFTQAQLEFAGGPNNPDYLLDCGELRTAFPELRLLFYRELRAGKGIASLLARKD
jgi:SAM-dependent methyltransferase